MGRKVLSWLLVLVLSISISGCGGKAKTSESAAFADQAASAANNGITVTSKDAQEANNEAPQSAASGASAKSNSAGGQKSISGGIAASVDVSQKVIFKGQIDFETLNFDKTITNLSSYITSVGGYQQSSSVHGGNIGYTGLRSAEYVFRIPKTRYMQAFVDMKKFGTIVFEQSTGEDITDQYFDTEARLKSLRVRQDRLMALLEKAVKMEDILKIEKDLQDTLYEIENYTGTLKKWDSMVEYSTLAVNVREVAEIKPDVKENDGLFKRIAVGFKNSVTGVWEFIQSLLIFIASALPIILPLGLIGYIAYRVFRKRRKNSKASEEDKRADKE